MLIEPNYISKFKIEKDSHEFKEVCKKWQPLFKENIWWLPYKYPLNSLKKAFRVCQKQEVYTIAYIVGILNNLQ